MIRSLVLGAVLLSTSAFAGNICEVAAYFTNEVLAKSVFGPPPSGWGAKFPWTDAQVSKTVEVLKWSAKTGYSAPGTEFDLTGTASYVVLAFDRAQCAADFYIDEIQGEYFGSYTHEGVLYKLYAFVTGDRRFNVNMKIAGGKILRKED